MIKGGGERGLKITKKVWHNIWTVPRQNCSLPEVSSFWWNSRNQYWWLHVCNFDFEFIFKSNLFVLLFLKSETGRQCLQRFCRTLSNFLITPHTHWTLNTQYFFLNRLHLFIIFLFLEFLKIKKSFFYAFYTFYLLCSNENWFKYSIYSHIAIIPYNKWYFNNKSCIFVAILRKFGKIITPCHAVHPGIWHIMETIYDHRWFGKVRIVYDL